MGTYLRIGMSLIRSGDWKSGTIPDFQRIRIGYLMFVNISVEHEGSVIAACNVYKMGNPLGKTGATGRTWFATWETSTWYNSPSTLLQLRQIHFLSINYTYLNRNNLRGYSVC